MGHRASRSLNAVWVKWTRKNLDDILIHSPLQTKTHKHYKKAAQRCHPSPWKKSDYKDKLQPNKTRLALKPSFTSSIWVIWPPNSVSSTPGFTFRIILSGSWHNLSLWHRFFFPEKSSLCHCARSEPLLPASDPCELRYAANSVIPLPRKPPYICLAFHSSVSCSSERTQLFCFKKSHQFFPPGLNFVIF